MGSLPRAFDDQWTPSQELDDGWSLDSDTTTVANLQPAPVLPAPVQPTVVNLNTCLGDDVNTADWSLAREHQRSVPEVSLRSAIVNPLSDEELEEFSRAELAMGTEVGLPVSEELWFEELRCIVPRRRAPSVSEHVPAAKPLTDLPLLAKPEEFSPVVEAAAPVAKKSRWWKRLRRS